MKKYIIELEVKVWLLGNGYDLDTIKLSTFGKNSHNALLEVFKTLDLDDIKFIRKNTIKYAWENDWQKAISFEIIDVNNIKVKEDD